MLVTGLLKKILASLFLCCLLACAPAPLIEYSADSEPLILLPANIAGSEDGRGRFREIYCSLSHLRADDIPDYRPCEEVLVTLGSEPPASGDEVAVAASASPLIAGFVPGLGWECLEKFIDPDDSIERHLEAFGYTFLTLDVGGLTSGGHNAKQLRDAILALDDVDAARPLVLLGYSKGAPDILEALVDYPEIRSRVAAVVSISGAIGGSPLANSTEQSTANLLRFVPGSDCDVGDQGAVDSMKPAVRRKWLAENPLPEGIRYYSLVSFPEPDNISKILRGNYNSVSQVDARNDSQLVFYDQVIPGSTLLAYINADHWSMMVPIARSRGFIGATFVNHNALPRELLLEAVLRFVEEDLARQLVPGAFTPR